MTNGYHIVVCGSIVPDPLQTLEPVQTPTGPALKNEMMLPAVLDPWAAHALYEATNLASKAAGSKVWLVSVGPKAKLQQVMMTIAQRVSFELVPVDASASGFADAHSTAALLAETIQSIERPAIHSSRAREIQGALIREHYLQGEPSGTWDAATQAAMQRYQADQGWQSKTTPGSPSPDQTRIRPEPRSPAQSESAMTMPAAPSAADSKDGPKTIECGAKHPPTEDNLPKPVENVFRDGDTADGFSQTWFFPKGKRHTSTMAHHSYLRDFQPGDQTADKIAMWIVKIAVHRVCINAARVRHSCPAPDYSPSRRQDWSKNRNGAST